MSQKFQIKTIRRQVEKGRGIIIHNWLHEVAELSFRKRFKVAFDLIFKRGAFG
jgi:uncharacterized protein YheU (UPF0270 family)